MTTAITTALFSRLPSHSTSDCAIVPMRMTTTTAAATSTSTLFYLSGLSPSRPHTHSLIFYLHDHTLLRLRVHHFRIHSILAAAAVVVVVDFLEFFSFPFTLFSLATTTFTDTDLGTFHITDTHLDTSPTLPTVSSMRERERECTIWLFRHLGRLRTRGLTGFAAIHPNT